MTKSVSAAGLGAELAERTKLGDVEINFQDAPLRQHEIDPQRQRKLQYFADRTRDRPQKQIFRDLLGDGGSAANLPTILGILDRLAQGPQVNAVMLAEMSIFRPNHRTWQRGRNRIEIDPLPRDRLARRPAPQHKRRDRMAGTIKGRHKIGQQHRSQQNQQQISGKAQIRCFAFEILKPQPRNGPG